MDDKDKSDKKKLNWEQQELPRAYLRLEGILYQTSWIIQQELRRQQKAMEGVKRSVERDVRDPSTWKK